MTEDRDELIRQRAYRIWQEEGEPEGRDHDHWTRAEQEHGAEPSDKDALLPGAADDLPFGEPADTGSQDSAVSNSHPQTIAAEPSDSTQSSPPAADSTGAKKPRRGKGSIRAVT
ncbi:DUF2934 domain-containing protein [Sphingomonas sp.]|jgi:hypothetical protein|uniref:DUF2934 domain-containing protein n=1 Tax=Sphingomonas sp. TaxID=28214 RepID=UPI0026399E18|nr:DUF2934 domain-containing protein [Sphingomonas sp.]MDF2494204.1 hypothetical protein [Sphingomonas sp.]